MVGLLMDAAAWFAAAARHCPPRHLTVVIDGLTVAFSVAGPQLADRLFAPLAHLRRADGADGDPDIHISAFCAAEANLRPPAEVPAMWFDPDSGRGFCHFADVETLRRIDIARPFQRILIGCLAARGRTALHAALLAPSGTETGLLLLGPNGSGKSTTCLSALLAGFSMVADDCLVLGASGAENLGHSLYRSCCLTEQSEAFFASLPGHLWRPPSDDFGTKRVLMLSDRITATAMVPVLPISALVFPVILGRQVPSSITPVGPAEAQRRLVPGGRLLGQLSLDQRRRGFAALNGLASRLPAFRLDMGMEMGAVPALLDGLARHLASRTAA